MGYKTMNGFIKHLMETENYNREQATKVAWSIEWKAKRSKAK